MRGHAVTNLVLMLVFVGPLYGQECEFEPSGAAQDAAAALQRMTARSSPEDERAIYLEAWGELEDAMGDGGGSPVELLLATQISLGLQEYGRALDLIQRYEERAAPACLEHAETMRTNGWTRLYNRGIGTFNAADTLGALNLFEQANEWKADGRSLNNAALIHQDLGNNEQALALFDQVLNSDADDRQMRTAQAGRARLLARQGDAAGAVEAMQSHRWTGSGDRTTRSFEMLSSEWRLAWDVESDSDAVYFSVSVYRPDGTLVTQASASGVGPGETFVHEAGRFYVEVSVAGVDGWDLEATPPDS